MSAVVLHDDTPWWCGYPGCKVTGECGNTEYGPCPPEDNEKGTER